MAGMKRQGIENVILYRICMFLWNMMKWVRNHRSASRPMSYPCPDKPAEQRRTNLWSGSSAGGSAPTTGKRGNAASVGRKIDTKFASAYAASSYARHQMERHSVQAAEGCQMLLSEIGPAADNLPDGGRSGRWRTAVGKKRHQISKCICGK